MARVAVMTDDFSLYHDLVGRLKRRGIPFESLSPKEAVPADIEVVITGPKESEAIKFRPLVVTRADLDDAIDQALKTLAGRGPFQILAVGIDPGRHIGVAALADGAVVSTATCETVDEAVNRVRLLLERHEAKRKVIRIGHGSPTLRNVLIQRLHNVGAPMEIVDESSTTEFVDLPDVRAAISIAATRGERVERPPSVRVPAGEIKDIQRLSRIKSGGRFTIPRDLARQVAVGAISLDEAVHRFRRERHADDSIAMTKEEE